MSRKPADGTEKNKERQIRGVSLKKLNYFMAAITLVVSVLILFSTYRTTQGYQQMRDATEQYISCQQRANDLQAASDYLTDQVQCFAVTGKIEFMNNYFKEANETKRRDLAIEKLKEELDGSRAYQSLLKAMESSVHLMQREYYSMRLMAEAQGFDPAVLPEEIRNVTLTAADAALSSAEKEDLARSMVHDEIYHLEKDAISRETENCLGSLIDETERSESASMELLSGRLFRQQILIILLIVTVILVIVLTSLQVISPLVKAIPEIRADKPLPIEGAYEYRYLAATYNQMYESNKERRKHLAYKASHDKLTGLYNRGGFDEHCRSTDLSRAALILVDIDNFKTINDTFGHDVGDAALKRMTAAMQKYFRAEDWMFRVGGDEFVVIAENTTPEKSAGITDKIVCINEELSNEEGSCPAVSVTAGIAFGYDGVDPDELFKKADLALYRAKKSGKHGCAVYDDKEASNG